MAKNVIIYCRVSTDKQSKTWESLEEQERECRAYCKRNNYQVLAVFSEQFTWTKDERPKVEEALNFIRHSELKIDYVVVLKIDRVSRWWITIHDSFKKKFQDLGVSLRDTHGVIWEDRNVVEIEWVNTDKYNWAKTNMNQIAENVTVMMSENERNTILQRLIWQAIKNNKRWYKVRNSEFWFKNTKIMTEFWKKTIQVENPEESVYIKKMFELKARWDLSESKIVQEINLMGFKSRQKIKWNKEKTRAIWATWWAPLTIRQLERYLSHTVYAGVICEEWTWNKPVKTPYSWFISVDLWNRANRWKSKINIVSDDEIVIEHYHKWEQVDAPVVKKFKSYNPEYPFWKVLKCPICWGHLTAERARSKNWVYHYYYSCRGKLWRAKHKNYALRRDEINDGITSFFSKIKFDKKSMNFFEQISEVIFEARKNECIEKNKLITQNIRELESKKRYISEHIMSILNYPDLLENQNDELQKIKKEISKLQTLKVDIWSGIRLDRFKKCSKKILEHPESLLQRDKPELIQLAFELFFDWKIEYEQFKARTPITQEFWLLQNKKDFQESWKSVSSHEWWSKNKNRQTIYNWIVKLIDGIDKWQYVIDKI